MLALVFSTVNGHGNMVSPVTWFNPSGSSVKPTQTCDDSSCLWFTNYTFVEKATLPEDSPLRTYRDIPLFNTPWAAPGSAKVFSPCGIYGGNPNGCPIGDESSRGKACPGGGTSYGPDALDIYGLGEWLGKVFGKNAPSTTWKAGSVVEAGWGINANHGGGYQYRLCKIPAEGVSHITEECFQQMPLEFATSKSYIQWGEDPNSRKEFEAVRTNQGTMPKNSTWARDPIPACAAPDGGAITDTSDACSVYGGKTQFKPPVPGVQGFGAYYRVENFSPTFHFHIVDKLQVPRNLEPGKYVLGFRWDCEQTPQIWTTCSSIDIEA